MELIETCILNAISDLVQIDVQRPGQPDGILQVQITLPVKTPVSYSADISPINTKEPGTISKRRRVVSPTFNPSQ